MKTSQWVKTMYVRGELNRPLRIGDRFEFTCNGSGRGGHYGVTANITKINRKTVDATEAERSYSPGTRWRVRMTQINEVILPSVEA